MPFSPGDWDALTKLAGQVDLSAERVGLLRRLENDAPRPGAPYTLLAGRPDAGLELLLARWISPQAADALKLAGDRPLVLGPAPREVKPRVGAWPTFPWPAFRTGHLLALRLTGKLPADLAAQLAALGGVEQVVWVTRLSQALNQSERDSAGAFRTLAATARVLVVGLAGEEVSESELAEVSAFAANQMRQLGYKDGRCLGAGVWFAGAVGKRPGAVEDLFTFLILNDAETAAGRIAMARQAVTDLLAEVGRRAKESAPAPLLPIDEKERDRLTRELSGYLADLGRELNTLVESGRPQTAESLRRYALDALRGWGAYTTVEGHWMKYVERLRPGVQATFLTEAESALAGLEYDPPAVPAKAAVPTAPSSPLVERAIVEAKRGAVGLVCGVAAYVAVSSFVTPPATNLPPVVASLLSYLAMGLAMILGYATGRGFFRLPTTAPAETAVPSAPRIHGWPQVERRLTAWFVERITVKPISPADECRLLARRLGVEEENP